MSRMAVFVLHEVPIC